jgi:hypothetical protein
MTPVGLPHSEISGSTPACDSPKLFAANHVLHRLLMPRHSPCALSSLTTNLEKLVSASHYFLHIAIRRLQGRDRSSRNEPVASSHSPLTLDCFLLETCDLKHSLALKTRFRVVICYCVFRELTEVRRLSAKGEHSIRVLAFRQLSLAGGA